MGSHLRDELIATCDAASGIYDHRFDIPTNGPRKNYTI